MNIRIIILICLILVGCGNSELEIKLIEANKSGDLSEVQNLLSQGANVNCRDEMSRAIHLYFMQLKLITLKW